MTIQDFKASLKELSPIPIITLFNTSSQDGLQSTIDAIAIKTDTVDTEQLKQAKELTIRTPSGSGYIHIALQSSTLPRRTINTSIVDDYFVYEIYPPNQRQVIQTPITSSNGYWQENTAYILEPTEQTTRFAISDYNIIIGSIQESRESQYTLKSDRSSTRTTGSLLNPLNIVSILADTAEPADIQDSNYSSKTWINPRYEGSKITTLTNGGTDPFIQGTFFEGAFFTSTVKDSSITSASIANTVAYKQNFSTGKLDIPKYVVEKLNLGTRVQYNPSASFLEVTSSATPLNKDLVLGDILIFSSSAGFSQEVLQLLPPTGSQTYFPYEYLIRTPTKETVQISVKRGSSSTKAQIIPINSQLYRVISTKAYDLVGTIITPVKQGKLLIRDTGDILSINSDGIVVSGSSRINYEDL